MPICTPDQYREMIDAAQRGGYAFPAVNVSSVTAINAALRGFSQAKSDGILQILPAAAEMASGATLKNLAVGAIVLAEAAHRLAEQHDVRIALHTDHCPPELVESFMLPLIEETARRRANGLNNLFQSHMFDGSKLTMDDNLEQAVPLMKRCAENDILLEVEVGVVAGLDEVTGEIKAADPSFYTTPEDMLRVHDALAPLGRYLLAPSFGNIHGSYKAGSIELRPEILRQGQNALARQRGAQHRFDLVFHGGSSSPLEQVRQAVSYGVVKMNLDSDTQYAFTRPIADHFFTNYRDVLQIDGGMGRKAYYDPRSYLRKAEESMADRVAQACNDLLCAGHTLGRPGNLPTQQLNDETTHGHEHTAAA